MNEIIINEDLLVEDIEYIAIKGYVVGDFIVATIIQKD